MSMAMSSQLLGSTSVRGSALGVLPHFVRKSTPLGSLPRRSLCGNSRGFTASPVPQRSRRIGDLLVLREASSTEVAGASTSVAERPIINDVPEYDGEGVKPTISTVTFNGNGNGHMNGAFSNGNGNGKSASAGSLLVEAATAEVVAYSSNGNGNGHMSVPASTASHPMEQGLIAQMAAPPEPEALIAAVEEPLETSTASVMSSEEEEAMNAEAAGQLELAAATAEPRQLAEVAVAQKMQELEAEDRKAFTAAGTPYKAPGGRWSKFKTYSVWQRSCEIWGFALQFAIRYFLLGRKFTYGKGGMTPEAVSARKRELAIWLREGLVKLGPTFIKIGQQFSTRVDVLSPEFVKELEKLQDNVPPFDWETAGQILESNLGAPVEQVFEEFDKVPIAAASLGQVHLAKLNGERVVVKVQRPGLKDLFDIDLKNIRALAVWLQKVDPKTDGAARDWVAIYDECSRILYQEIDYRLEGKNADQFRENFKKVDWIKVPRVYWQYSTSEILVLEYCPGKKINDGPAIDAMGLERKRLARLTVESYLQQILRYGFFHADPHPGNVAVDAVNGGRLIYYDYGMMGTIPGGVRGGLLDLFYGVYNKDADKCLEALITMGVLVPTTGDRTAIRRTAEFFLKTFQDRLDEQKRERETKGAEYNKDYKPQRSKDEAKQRRKQILSSIGEDLLVAANDQPFRFPATFTFVVRSFTVLDGIGKSLDPRFDITEISAPYARELLLEARPQFAKIADDIRKRASNQNRAIANLFKGPNQIENIADVMTRLERGDLKLRVRALEAERALTRVQAWQRVMVAALAATTCVNVGTVLSVSALSTGATLSFLGAGMFGLMVLSNYLKVVNLEKKERQILGTVA